MFVSLFMLMLRNCGLDHHHEQDGDAFVIQGTPSTRSPASFACSTRAAAERSPTLLQYLLLSYYSDQVDEGLPLSPWKKPAFWQHHETLITCPSAKQFPTERSELINLGIACIPEKGQLCVKKGHDVSTFQTHGDHE
jgi:hypothetical protein